MGKNKKQPIIKEGDAEQNRNYGEEEKDNG